MACEAHPGHLDWRYVIILLLCLFILVGPHYNWKTQGTFCKRKTVSVVLKRTIQVAKARQLPNITQLGTSRFNYMDTRADTCCAGANWKLVSFSNKVFEVSPFLDSYQTVKEITVARVSTVWMEPNKLWEYLIIVDLFLWFGTMMDHSIINLNQVRAFNIQVHDNTFDATFL